MFTRKALEDDIISILTHQRSRENPRRPRPISLSAISCYLQHRLGPNDPEIPREQIQQSLERLEAKGEIIAGARRSYCMARPFVVLSSDGLNDALFVGDRTYLRQAAECLETAIDTTDPVIRSQLTPEQARKRLTLHDIGILSLADLQEKLPMPCLPAARKLLDAFPEKKPFEVIEPVENYDPSLSSRQSRRWQSLYRGQPQRSPLYRLPDGSYAWFDGQETFALDRSTAQLAMFCLDQQAEVPALVIWDARTGILDLTDILLPLEYWRVVSRLSDEVDDQYRRRFVRTRYRDAVVATFLRLGIKL